MKTPATLLLLFMAAALPVLTGCVGTTRAVVASSTNFGVDVDTTPPHADISLGRREFAAVPGFQGGKTVPTVMGFQAQNDNNLLKRMFVGVGTVFSTGEAANLLTDPEGAVSSDDEYERLDKVPHAAKNLREMVGNAHVPVQEGTMRPLIFGTKTLIGFHTAWDPATGAPSELKVGFNRKEVALAPLGVEQDPQTKKRLYRARIPSTLASLNTSAGTSAERGSDFRSIQWFATGRAAEHLAKREDVGGALLKRIEPAAKFKADTETYTSNTTLISEIEDAYKAADAERQRLVISKAEGLFKLSGVTGKNLGKKLRRLLGTGDATLSANLQQLLTFAQS